MKTILCSVLLLTLLTSTSSLAMTSANIEFLNYQTVLALARARALDNCQLVWKGPGGSNVNNRMVIEILNSHGKSQEVWSLPWFSNMSNETDAFSALQYSRYGADAARVLRDLFRVGACK